MLEDQAIYNNEGQDTNAAGVKVPEQQISVGGNIEGVGIAIGPGAVSIVYLNNDQDQVPHFELVSLPEEYKTILHEETILALVNELYHSQLVILPETFNIQAEIIVHELIYRFQQIFGLVQIWRWPEETEEPNLDILFISQNTSKKNSGIYICFGVSPQVIDGVDLATLRRTLAARHQYIILVTYAMRNMWQLDILHRSLWHEVPEHIYAPQFLEIELRSALGRAISLPEPIASNLSSPHLLVDVTISSIATQLGTPTNIDVFVMRLNNQNSVTDLEHLNRLILETRKQDHDQKIYYLFKQLGSRKKQLLAVGLCLFGGSEETLFFSALHRLITGPWQHMFQRIRILDYFHLDALYSLLTVQDNCINHRHPHQRESLLKFAWQNYQYHIRKALPEIPRLVEESVQMRGHQSKRKPHKLRDEHFRILISEVLAGIGCLSLAAVEDTLLSLAIHSQQGMQATAARAIAQCYRQGGTTQQQTFDLLFRWQQEEWRQLGEKQEEKKKYIQLTVARTVYHILLQLDDEQLPAQLPKLLWALLFSHYKEIHDYYQRFIHRKLFPRYLNQIIRDWCQPSYYPTSNPAPDYWVTSLIIFGRTCDEYEQLDKIASWLIKGLARNIQGVGRSFQALTDEQKRWLAQRVFPRYLRELHQLLLTLLQEGRFESGMVDIFVLAYQTQPQEVLQLLNDWCIRWQQTLEKQDEGQTTRWLVALPMIGMIYGAIHEFQAFMTWLTVWLEHLEWSHYADIVSVLVEIHRYQVSVKPLQAVVDDNTVVAEIPTLASVTSVEDCLYDWLIDSKAGADHHIVTLLFWNEVQKPGLTKICITHELPQLSGKAQLGMAMFSHDRQIVIQNLLPVACIINSIEKETINAVVAQWQTVSRPEINRIGTDLAYALQISNTGCFLGLLFALRQLLIELVEQLYPLLIKAIRWILIGK